MGLEAKFYHFTVLGLCRMTETLVVQEHPPNKKRQGPPPSLIRTPPICKHVFLNFGGEGAERADHLRVREGARLCDADQPAAGRHLQGASSSNSKDSDNSNDINNSNRSTNSNNSNNSNDSNDNSTNDSNDTRH